MIDVEKMRQKILDLAIRGKLVPQDPNEEPASALLERIRAEQEKLYKEGKIKKLPEFSYIYRGSDNRYYEKSGTSVTDVTEEIPFPLPKGWCWSRLDSLAKSIAYGVSYSAQKVGTNKYLRITDIQEGVVNWDTVPYATIKANENDSILQEKDIVFARTGATVGKSFLILNCPINTVFASYLIRVRMVDINVADYVYAFFNSVTYWKAIIDQSVGTGQPNCNGTKLANLLIPIPPMLEQKRIMFKLNKALAVLVKIKGAQESIVTLSNRFKKAILAEIFSSDKSYYPKVKLCDALYYIQPGPYIVDKTEYASDKDEEYSTPVLTPGKTFVLGYTNEKHGIYAPSDKVIIFDDFTTASRLVDFPFKVKSSAMKILVATDPRRFCITYLFNLLQTIHPILGTHKRFWISEFSAMSISVPPIDIQQRKVRLVEAFEKIISPLYL